VRRALRAGHYIPFVVQFDASIEPRRIRLGADEHEQLSDRELLCRARGPIANRHRFEVPRLLAVQGGELRTDQNIDVSQRPDAVDQIARHRSFEAATPDDHRQTLDVRCEEHRRLSGGVAGTHQGDFRTGAEFRLRRRCPVVDAVPLERAQVGHRGPFVACARSDHDRLGANRALLRKR
jgi:hypothetical protein